MARSDAQGEVISIDDDGFRLALLSPRPVLVVFSATGCRWCRRLASILPRIAKRFVGRVTVAKLDITTAKLAPAHMGVSGVPILVLLSRGREIGRKVGYGQEEEIAQIVDRALEPRGRN